MYSQLFMPSQLTHCEGDGGSLHDPDFPFSDQSLYNGFDLCGTQAHQHKSILISNYYPHHILLSNLREEKIKKVVYQLRVGK